MGIRVVNGPTSTGLSPKSDLKPKPGMKKFDNYARSKKMLVAIDHIRG